MHNQIPEGSMMSKLSTFAMVAIVALGAAACGGDSPTGGNNNPPPPAPPPPGGTVIINLTAGLRFVPAEVTIAPGTTVRWVYQGGGGHTVTPGNAGQDGVWARQVMNGGGQTFEHTFNVGGQTYDYFCEPHELQGMTGRVIVQ
jgi:plastocyanin